MAWTTPRDWTDSEVVGATIMNTYIRDNQDYLYAQFPTRVVMEHHMSLVQAGNALTVEFANQDSGAPRTYQDAAAIDDQFTHEFVLAEGDYTLGVRGRSGTDAGIMSIKIDDAVVGTIDFYAGSAADAIKTITGVTVTGSGKHTLQVTMSTKNGSSSDYYCRLYKMYMTPESGF